ncbi:putative Heat shock protein 70 family [Helianthus anomalus]
MVKDGEKYRLQDQEYKKRMDAYNAFEVFLYHMKNRIKEYTIKKSVQPKRLKKMENAISDTTKWLEKNQVAPVEEFRRRKVFLESVFASP